MPMGQRFKWKNEIMELLKELREEFLKIILKWKGHFNNDFFLSYKESDKLKHWYFTNWEKHLQFGRQWANFLIL